MKKMSFRVLYLAMLMASPIAMATDSPVTNEPETPVEKPARVAVTPLEKVFSQMDTDLNNEVSRDELKVQARSALLLDNFSTIDKDHNNGLSLKEIEDYMGDLRKKQQEFLERMKTADKDGDGAWTVKELKSAKGKLASLEKNFKAIDINHDKKITEQEIAAFAQRTR